MFAIETQKVESLRALRLAQEAPVTIGVPRDPGEYARARRPRGLKTRVAVSAARLAGMIAGKRGLEDIVATYRCFLMSGEGIRSVEILECPDDVEAGVKATALLRQVRIIRTPRSGRPGAS